MLIGWVLTAGPSTSWSDGTSNYQTWADANSWAPLRLYNLNYSYLIDLLVPSWFPKTLTSQLLVQILIIPTLLKVVLEVERAHNVRVLWSIMDSPTSLLAIFCVLKSTLVQKMGMRFFIKEKNNYKVKRHLGSCLRKIALPFWISPAALWFRTWLRKERSCPQKLLSSFFREQWKKAETTSFSLMGSLVMKRTVLHLRKL